MHPGFNNHGCLWGCMSPAIPNISVSEPTSLPQQVEKPNALATLSSVTSYGDGNDLHLLCPVGQPGVATKPWK